MGMAKQQEDGSRQASRSAQVSKSMSAASHGMQVLRRTFPLNSSDVPIAAPEFPCYTARSSRLPALVRRSEPQETDMIRPQIRIRIPVFHYESEARRTRAQDHPHLSRRRPARISKRHDRPRDRQEHLAFARQAHGGDGAGWHACRPQRPHRERCEDRVGQPRGYARAGIDPARLRACAGGSRAGAVAGHAGDDRPRDRERLLLRLLPQRALHAGRFCRDREEDARDHRARQALHQGSLGSREDQAGVPRQGRGLQGRAGRRHSRQRADQDLFPGRLVRSLPRPAHDLDGQDRQTPSS